MRSPRAAEDRALSEHKTIRTGRNLPVAIAVGLGLGAIVLATLLTVKATFLLVIGALVGAALWELRGALRTRNITIPVIPIAIGGVAMVTLAYWEGAQPGLAALAVTFIAILAWRLPGGSDGYVADVTAGVLTLIYLPGMAVFVGLMLGQSDGAHRTLLFVILAVCSDTGGYFAGILTGRHYMAPSISPKKTWEGFAGSAAACLIAGWLGMTLLLPGGVWGGLALGAAAVVAATLGDLAESMIKRDLQTKDMSSLLPGHGGVLDRLDSLLIVAPVAWLLMTVFLSAGR
ncbi:MAG: phosphatidate cytidylyltransferase [Streptosporangiaceae bacterium]